MPEVGVAKSRVAQCAQSPQFPSAQCDMEPTQFRIEHGRNYTIEIGKPAEHRPAAVPHVAAHFTRPRHDFSAKRNHFESVASNTLFRYMLQTSVNFKPELEARTVKKWPAKSSEHFCISIA